MKTKNIKYGKTDILSKNEFDTKNTKIRITTFIDLDILNALKSEADKNGKKYQTLLNEKLRHALFDENNIHDEIMKLAKRLSKIEKKVS
ncbi:MAG TPA: BrnA antitoxin family protein [Spirochaetota bacterium]|nr:BrnA antitoxin family protein [Spirochaetota bacterium]